MTTLLLSSSGARAADGGSERRLIADRTSDNPEEIFATDTLCILGDSDHGWRPCRGSDRDALSYRDFYRAAGRFDLADRDHSRWWRRQMLIASGVGLTVVGALGIVSGLVLKPIVPTLLSVGVATPGVTLIVWGAGVSHEPLIGPGDAADVARSYNRELRERLGLPVLEGHRLTFMLGASGRF